MKMKIIWKIQQTNIESFKNESNLETIIESIQVDLYN